MILHGFGLRVIYYRGYEHHFRFNYLLLVLQIFVLGVSSARQLDVTNDIIFVLVCLLPPLVVVYRNLT